MYKYFHKMKKNLIHASRSKILKFKKKGGSVEVKRSGLYNETATPINGIVGLSSKPMDVNPAKTYSPIGVTGPINITGQRASFLGSGLNSISFSESKKPKKAKLKI